MARIEDFEGCCTAKIIVDLGGSHTSEFGYHPAKYDQLRKKIVRLVEEEQDYKGIICAIATSEQVTAQKVLKDLGFTGTGMAKKNSHAEVDIELYYLHCKDWIEPEKPADIVAPEAPVAAPQPFAAARNPAPQLAPIQSPVPRRGDPPARDAQGRFVSRNEVRGYITRQLSVYNLVERNVGSNGAFRWTNVALNASTFTRAEYEAFKRDRIGFFPEEIFFQPI